MSTNLIINRSVNHRDRLSSDPPVLHSVAYQVIVEADLDQLDGVTLGPPVEGPVVQDVAVPVIVVGVAT